MDSRGSEVFVGGDFSVFLNNGRAFSCGTNQDFRLGLGKTQVFSSTKAMPITSISEKVSQVACGVNFMFFLTESGTVLGVGSNMYGNLCQSALSVKGFKTPQKVPFFEGKDVESIECGVGHVAFRTSDNKVYMCGLNSNGQLGLGKGDTEDRSTPALIPKFSKKDGVVNVSCGSLFTFFETEKGQVYSTGDNSHGQLGVGDTKDRTVPTRVKFPRSDKQVKAYAHGRKSSLFLTMKNNIFFCGDATIFSVAGMGKVYKTPKRLKIGGKQAFVGIACGGGNAFFISPTDVFSCGKNEFGQRGSNTLETKIKKVKFKDRVEKIVTSGEHTFFITVKGVLGAGKNDVGQLGVGKRFGKTKAPVVIPKLPAWPKKVVHDSPGVEDGRARPMSTRTMKILEMKRQKAAKEEPRASESDDDISSEEEPEVEQPVFEAPQLDFERQLRASIQEDEKNIITKTDDVTPGGPPAFDPPPTFEAAPVVAPPSMDMPEPPTMDMPMDDDEGDDTDSELSSDEEDGESPKKVVSAKESSSLMREIAEMKANVTAESFAEGGGGSNLLDDIAKLKQAVSGDEEGEESSGDEEGEDSSDSEFSSEEEEEEKKIEEERKRREAEAKKRGEEAERKKKEEEAKRAKEEEERLRKEEEANRAKEEEERLKKEAEADAERIRLEEERVLAEEEERKRLQLEEAKRKEEEEARRKAEEEEARRKAEEEKERQRLAEEERKRKEEEARLLAEKQALLEAEKKRREQKKRLMEMSGTFLISPDDEEESELPPQKITFEFENGEKATIDCSIAIQSEYLKEKMSGGEMTLKLEDKFVAAVDQVKKWLMGTFPVFDNSVILLSSTFVLAKKWVLAPLAMQCVKYVQKNLFDKLNVIIDLLFYLEESGEQGSLLYQLSKSIIKERVMELMTPDIQQYLASKMGPKTETLFQMLFSGALMYENVAPVEEHEDYSSSFAEFTEEDLQKQVREHMRSLLHDNISKNIVFVTLDGKRVKLHQEVMAKCPHFKELMEIGDRKIVTVDITSEVFLPLVLFIYSGEIPGISDEGVYDIDTLLILMNSARRVQLDDLFNVLDQEWNKRYQTMEEFGRMFFLQNMDVLADLHMKNMMLKHELRQYEPEPEVEPEEEEEPEPEQKHEAKTPPEEEEEEEDGPPRSIQVIKVKRTSLLGLKFALKARKAAQKRKEIDAKKAGEEGGEGDAKKEPDKGGGEEEDDSDDDDDDGPPEDVSSSESEDDEEEHKMKFAEHEDEKRERKPIPDDISDSESDDDAEEPMVL